MIRTFLAVELPEAVRGAIRSFQEELTRRIQKELPKDARISWVQPASMHITIKFLGDTDDLLLTPLRDVVSQVAAAQEPVAVPIERLGAFPRLQAPRVLWVGPSEEWERGEEAQRLAAIHQVIEQGCMEFGFAREAKGFHPHLTLARIKDGDRPVGNGLARSGMIDRPVTLGSVPVDSIVLMKSDLRPTGSVYTKLWEVKVGAR
ncbi:MAG TPA: RNA 2',3'-cyclic phosphodiesterase [Nitrospiraceae bacterium]|nr:RNA 2',3'-cyclic phosphodiesterase [Nitrospiraceae bacterium]